jgi:hypothetical protein
VDELATRGATFALMSAGVIGLRYRLRYQLRHRLRYRLRHRLRHRLRYDAGGAGIA